MVRRRSNVVSALAALVITLGVPAANAHADAANGAPIDAIWRMHRVKFQFQSFNVRYSCDALQDKLGSILLAMGAHRDVSVEVNCPGGGGFVDSARMMVNVKLPVAASAENVRAATTYSTEQQLVARLHGAQLPSANDLPRFTAERRTITLTRNRRLRLDSGDCDLLTGVRDQLLPQLGISLTESGFRCYDGGTRLRPWFEVSALVAIPKPDSAPAVAAPVLPAPVALAAQPSDLGVD